MTDDVMAGPGANEPTVVLETGVDSEKTAVEGVVAVPIDAGEDSIGAEIVVDKMPDDVGLKTESGTPEDSDLDKNDTSMVSEALVDIVSDGLSDADKELLSELTKKTSSTERTAHAVKRERFMTMLGFDAKEVMPLYSRMCAMRLDPTFALLGDDPMSRVVRMDMWTEARRKVLPRPATSAFDRTESKRYFSIDTARAKAAFDDLEELNKMLIFSHVISGRLDDLLSEQRLFEHEIEERIALLSRREDTANDKVPSWAVLITRAIEAAGFGSVNHVAIRDNLVSDIAGAIEKASFGAPATGRRRLVEDILGMIEEKAATLPDGNDQTQKGDGAYDRMKTIMMDSLAIEESNMAGPFMAAGANDGAAVVVDGQSVPQALGSDDDDVAHIFALSSAGPLAPAFDKMAYRIYEVDEPKQRAGGHGLISGIESADEAYGGFASQLVNKMMVKPSHNAELGDVYIRMDERVPFAAEQFSVGLDGEIDPFNWAKFEVPAGPYKLVQMRDRSALLPRYTEYGMLPPVASMEDAGNLLGMTGEPGVQSNLRAWGPNGDGPAHTRAHVLDGSRGDPAEAIEVCRKLVAMQRVRWKDAEHVSDLAMESIARWWLFLLAGRMRPGQIDLLWPDGFFHGVEGHDPIVTDSGYYRLVRCDGGRIGGALKAD